MGQLIAWEHSVVSHQHSLTYLEEIGLRLVQRGDRIPYQRCIYIDGSCTRFAEELPQALHDRFRLNFHPLLLHRRFPSIQLKNLAAYLVEAEASRAAAAHQQRRALDSASGAHNSFTLPSLLS